jgi:hypothetical protein
LTLVQRSSLNSFFEPLIRDAHFGYVLFGSKPMALGSLVADEVRQILKPTVSRACISDFECWSRLANIAGLHSPNICIHRFEPAVAGGASEVVILNTELIGDLVKSHQSLFNKAFGDSFDGPQMCARILRATSLPEAFKDTSNKVREDLNGLLLGFPLQSTTGFLNHQCTSMGRRCFGYSSIDLVSQRSEGIRPVQFRVAEGDPEAMAVQQKFQREMVTIEKIMALSDWLDVVLQRLFLQKTSML